MIKKLFYNTVSPALLKVLKTLMAAKEFDAFRLVGGTALSLQCGHRQSADIDLFSDWEYGSLDFEAIYAFLKASFPYVDSINYDVIGMGKSYYVGQNHKDCIKLDLYYTDKFIEDVLLIDDIRLSSICEIIAMKVDIISKAGRKKDFWDLHELMDEYSFQQMLALHEKRHPYAHDFELIKNKFTEFTVADEDFEPVCLRGKHWEIIKLDLIDFANSTI